MTDEIFSASTQYEDMTGDAVADRADGCCATDWLRQNGHMSKDETLAGIKLYVGESRGEHPDPAFVTFLIMEVPGFDNATARISEQHDDEPVDVRRVVVEMDLVDFFRLFKRFSVTLSPLKEMRNRLYRY